MKGRAIEAMAIGDARFVVSVAVTFGMLLSGVFVQTAHAENLFGEVWLETMPG